MSETQTPQARNIESLPNEILTEILLHGAELILPPNSTDMVPFPTIASQVCRLWHELALATPDLWTTIRISADLASIQVANFYIARAGDRLLDITITLPGNGGTQAQAVGLDSSTPAIRPLDVALGMLGPHIARWRTLALHAGSSERGQLSDFLFKANPADLMQLTYLHLGEDMDQVFIAHFPRLRGIRVQDVGPLEFQLDEGMQFLHTLDISATNLTEENSRSIFEEAVGAMPQLTTLVLREFPWETPTQAFELPTVRSLAVQFICFAPENLEVLTTWVKAPNLEYLELANIFFEFLDEVPTLAEVPSAWEEPQFPSLHTLRLVDTKLTPRRLALLEILCSDITALELVNVTGTDTLTTVYVHTTFGSIHNLHSVEPSGDTNIENNPPWPSLRTLRVDSATFGPWVEQFAERRSLLGPDRGLTSLALAPEPDRDQLPVSLTAILDRAPFSTCGLLEGFVRPFFEDGSDFQVTRTQEDEEDTEYSEAEDTEYSENEETGDYDYDKVVRYYLCAPKKPKDDHEGSPDAGWDVIQIM